MDLVVRNYVRRECMNAVQLYCTILDVLNATSDMHWILELRAKQEFNRWLSLRMLR